MSDALNVFISFSHKDDSLREEFETHLALLKRQERIDAWSDRRITPGDEWAGKIDDNLEKADIVLLLVSPAFLASDYCFDVEMNRAMDRHESGEARVIPIILRPLPKAWKTTRFHKLQGLPTDTRAVTNWPSRDAAFVDVANGIDKAVTAELARRGGSGAGDGSPASSLGPRPARAKSSMPSPAPPQLPQLTCRQMDDAGYLAELASVFSTAASAYSLLEQAGVPRDRVQPFGQLTPIEFWEEVCRQLEKGLIPGGPSVLLEAAVKAYPYNAVFRKATA